MTIVALPAGCDQQPATCLLGSAWLCCRRLLLLAGCWLQEAAGWLAGMCGAGAMATVALLVGVGNPN
jgi:hypothetical protein